MIGIITFSEYVSLSRDFFPENDPQAAALSAINRFTEMDYNNDQRITFRGICPLSAVSLSLCLSLLDRLQTRTQFHTHKLAH